MAVGNIAKSGGLVDLALLFRDRQEVESRINLGSKCAPSGLLDGSVIFTQLAGGNAQRYHLAHAEQNVPRHRLNPLRRESFIIVLANQLLVDRIDGLGLIMSQDDGKQEFVFIRRRYSPDFEIAPRRVRKTGELRRAKAWLD